MIISPPFLPAAGAPSSNPDAPDPMMDAVDQFELAHSIYPIAFDRRWHTGVHLMPGTQNERVRAIADGEVVAYRVAQKAIDGGDGALDSNTGFVLLKHTTETGDGRSISFYSLYMHLLELDGYAGVGVQVNSLPEFLRTPTPDEGQAGGGKKVYRKDVLGLPGRCHGQRHVHFEIFMLPGDFNAYFTSTQLGNAQPVTPDHSDCWGHTYYMIRPGQTFLARPTGADAHNKVNGTLFPPLQGGTNQDYALHVETYFHKGARYTSSWRVEQDGTRTLLTPQPVKEAGFEYGLITRAKNLYPACPSDGLELMRFGRILTTPATLSDTSANTPPDVAAGVSGNPHPMAQASPRTTWLRVAYAPGQEGYLDVNGPGVVVLSDADFPFLAGWQKISEGNTPYSDDGMCDVDALKTIVGDIAPPSGSAAAADSGDALSNYVRDHEAVRTQLRGFICEAPTEWNSAHNDIRYAKLNDPEGFYGKQKETNPDGYAKFLDLLKKFQFWDKTSITEDKLWFFHPLQFIRYFRRCGWLSADEMARCFPRSLLHLTLTQFHASTTTWSDARARAATWALPFNQATRKYGVSGSRQRLLHFFSHVVPETGNLHYVREIRGETKSYNPYYGRGLIQLTHLDNYQAYGNFRKFPQGSAPAEYSALGWDPNALIARDNDGHHNAYNCVDSACFYVANRSNMLGHMDDGVSQDRAITVSKDVNGYVAIENLNGLEVRLQSVLYLRNALLDDIFAGTSVSLTFEWRRNSQQEPVLDAQGHPVMVGHPPHPKKKYYATQHTITSSLELQKP
ncbi:MAG: M23 family metallopeptidase [Paraburkholderia tropica]|uniref:M23 family metallopeptidase n=1 Tax=Paraburkholderia tropica TaxID=92647 RepID=UPI0031011B2F